MKILVIGANGFLGSELVNALVERNHNVYRGVSRKVHENEIVIPLDSIVELPKGDKPDLVIDVSNRYISKETSDSVRQMSDTILGVAKTIHRSNESWRAPLIQTTSYFQYCPLELQPWNAYSDIRNQSLQILQESAQASGQYLHEFVIHDTYGEKSRKKFLDLCLDAFQTREKLAAGDGYAQINLTHISDICNFIANQIENTKIVKVKDSRWDIKSSDSFTLRSLVKLLEELTGVENIVEWGKLKSSSREVLQLWDIPNARDNFHNKIKLQNWLIKKLSKEH